MARKSNKELVLTLAAELGVEVEYGQMGEDGFEVALYGYAAHMAFDPMGEGHTAITNQAGTGARTESRVWGMALEDLRQFVPCAEYCHCYSDAASFSAHLHNLTGDPSATDAELTPCAELAHCPSVCDCPPGACTAPVAPVADVADAEPVTHKTDVLYIAGWNMPGCLPEADPAIFDNETDAIRYLSDTVDRFWDEDSETDTNSAWHLGQGADEKWADVHSNLPYETAPFSIVNNDCSLAFWVTVVPKSDYPYNSEGN